MRYSSNEGKSFFQRFSATAWLIFVNVAFFVLYLILSVFFGPNLLNYLALYPASILQGKYVWTLLTHMFMHAGVFHLFINMFVLYSLGSLCEKIIGRKRYLWFYMLSGVFAGLLSVYLAGFFGFGFWTKVFGTPNIYMVGASGAIFAIAGLFVTLLPKIRFSIIFLPFFSLPGYVMVPLVLFLTWLASMATDLPIGNVAHFGGFLTGLIYGYYLRTKYKKKIKLLEKVFR
ncbi:MAG: rhomboid family intramembrane serine protease [Nanoarchaeota archaeon]